MKDFYCQCGQRVFFDNTSCLTCGRQIGFDSAGMSMHTVKPHFRVCENGVVYNVCNWLVPAKDDAKYCIACGLNEIIPNLETPGNLDLWRNLENAKRRMLYSLLNLGLPILGTSQEPPLRFRFLEDKRSNPDVLEDFVATGHQAGTITINIREADVVQITAEREAMHERYRTLLGHFRHEVGHYFFNMLVQNSGSSIEFRNMFGDERRDYAASMASHYSNGAPNNWVDNFVSPYAAAHPHEDWAETFAHYLHIVGALETARCAGFAARVVDGLPGWIQEWLSLSVTLNEINRSLGTDDSYPFVLTPPVIEKLKFIDRCVRQLNA